MAADLWHRLAMFAGDVRRWLVDGPSGYGSLLLAWSRAENKAADLNGTIQSHRRAHQADVRRLDDAHAELDDLCIRILETTLDVGRIAHVDVEVPAGMPHAAETYTRESVDRLLETARQALDSAEELARWATYRRRTRHLAGTQGPHADARTLESLLRRIETILADGVTLGEAEPDRIRELEQIDHAAAHVIELLRDVPLRRTHRPGGTDPDGYDLPDPPETP